MPCYPRRVNPLAQLLMYTVRYFMQDKVPSSLGSLHKVTHLRIVIYSQSKVDAATDLPVPLTPSSGLARAVHPSRFDFKGTAAALARPLPSLRFLSLTTCGRFVGPYEDDRDLATILPPHEPNADDGSKTPPILFSLLGQNIQTPKIRLAAGAAGCQPSECPRSGYEATSSSKMAHTAHLRLSARRLAI